MSITNINPSVDKIGQHLNGNTPHLNSNFTLGQFQSQESQQLMVEPNTSTFKVNQNESLLGMNRSNEYDMQYPVV
jgi:hypothetical protein